MVTEARVEEVAIQVDLEEEEERDMRFGGVRGTENSYCQSSKK